MASPSPFPRAARAGAPKAGRAGRCELHRCAHLLAGRAGEGPGCAKAQARAGTGSGGWPHRARGGRAAACVRALHMPAPRHPVPSFPLCRRCRRPSPLALHRYYNQYVFLLTMIVILCNDYAGPYLHCWPQRGSHPAGLAHPPPPRPHLKPRAAPSSHGSSLACAPQVVLLAAGYSTVPYRLATRGVRFFEVTTLASRWPAGAAAMCLVTKLDACARGSGLRPSSPPPVRHSTWCLPPRALPTLMKERKTYARSSRARVSLRSRTPPTA
jgi:hypothetical protein